MAPQISLIIPGIRPEMFQNVYDSFLKTWHSTFEIIFVGPKDCKLKTVSRGNVKCILEYGSPARALQEGWLNASADWVSFATDDCTFDSDTMNQAWRTLAKRNFDYKTVIVCKYTESDHWSKWMLTPWYYHAWFHGDFRHPNIPLHFKLYMKGLISKKIMHEIGGFNCNFESMAYVYNDLSMRLQFYGCKFIIERNRLDHCIWMPKESSDHSPVHHAVMEHDAPLFRGIYWAKHFKPQIKINEQNYKQAATYWPRRFS